jgi:hypothetical protein
MVSTTAGICPFGIYREFMVVNGGPSLSLSDIRLSLSSAMTFSGESARLDL